MDHLHLLDVARGKAALLRHLGVNVQVQHLAPPQELVERHLRVLQRDSVRIALPKQDPLQDGLV